MVVHTCNGSTWETEVGGSEVQGHTRLQETPSQKSKTEQQKYLLLLYPTTKQTNNNNKNAFVCGTISAVTALPFWDRVSRLASNPGNLPSTRITGALHHTKQENALLK